MNRVNQRLCALLVVGTLMATACGDTREPKMGPTDAGASWDGGVRDVMVGQLERVTTLRQDEATDHPSAPSDYVQIGNVGYFLASDAVATKALWRTDGSEAETYIVADINPYGADNPHFLNKVGNTLFLAADDGTHGLELFKSDGTAEGTTLVKDIHPTGDALRSNNFIAVGDTLYFTADDGTHGLELFKTDGTAEGTVLVKDLNPLGDAFDDYPSDVIFAVYQDELFFSATDGTHAHALFKTDGTAAGTTLVKDFHPENGPGYVAGDGDFHGPRRFVVVDETLFFTVDDGIHGWELYRSDGTRDGTVLVKDIHPRTDTAAAERGPRGLTNLNGTLFFSADDGVHGNELYRSDGTADGTVLVKDIHPSSNAYPDGLVVVDGAIYFRANDGAHGRELYISDGTAEGTVLVEDINPGPADSYAAALTRLGETLIVRADDGAHGTELYRIEGTPGRTALVKDIHPEGSAHPVVLGEINGELLLAADDGVHGIELFKTDGTPEGTRMVKNIHVGKDGFGPTYGPVAFRDRLLFWAIEESTGRELYASDGTESGTVLLGDFTPGPASSPPTALVVAGDSVFFGLGGNSGALHKTDGTPDGTVMVKDIYPGGFARIEELTAMDGSVFFRAEDGTHGAELYASDGTAEGTVMLKDIRPGFMGSNPDEITAVGEAVYFYAEDGEHGLELYRSDGTAEGTGMVKDIQPGPRHGTVSYYPGNATNFGGLLYFAADDGEHGLELYRSDGTAEGTVLVKDIYPGPVGTSPTKLTVVNETLFFRAGGGLYRSDGTTEGTVLVSGEVPTLFEAIPMGGNLYFIANGAHGRELYRSDGTAEGTVLVKDIHPRGSAGVTNLSRIGGLLFFFATDGIHGHEPYVSNGTAEGTVMVHDIYAGPHGSYTPPVWQGEWAALGDRVYFSAADVTHGTQLWMIDLEP